MENNLVLNCLQKLSITPHSLLNNEILPDLKETEFTTELAIDLFNLAKLKRKEVRTTLSLWISKLLCLNLESINISALMTKIHKCIQGVKAKRGAGKEEFLSKVFHVPFCTTTGPEKEKTCKPSDLTSELQLETTAETKKFHQLQQKIDQKREKIKELQNSNLLLRRKK